MFSSFILGECGLDDWSVNSEIVRAVADSPLGPYTMAERVAGPFAHEPNLAQGRLPGGELILLGTMNRHKQPPPAGLINCSRAARGEKRVAEADMPPPKDTYAWVAKTPQGMAAAEPMLVLNSTRYDNDPNVHHTNRTAVCDTNLAGAILPNGSLVGVWRHCETVNLHTVPHSLLAVDAKDPLTYTPSNEVNCAHTPSRVGSLQGLTANCLQSLSSPTRARKTRTSTCRATWCTRCCMTSRSRAARTARSAAGPAAATPSAWIMGAPSRIRRLTHGVRRFHFLCRASRLANLESITIADGTVQWREDDESVSTELLYLRARPHLLLGDDGNPTHLSTGARPTRASDYVYTLVVPIEP